ncbi:voltage-gated potassium channel protein [Acidiphilium iwatense]|uniref:Voltage-gated potassium channel protein n=2 Tax=Acidocellaceae TaxID=3385905 RepID=A0ABS9DSZ8_9PROT|nr:voltage-gated potassium channel protein [Acidiphilium iwatense]
MDLWFPQVPLALAVGGAGIFAILPTIRRYAAEYLHLKLGDLFHALQPIAGHVPRLILSGVPTVLVGALQILIAIGLLGRSRIAWLSALGITLAQLILTIAHTSGSILTYETIYICVLLVALMLARDAFRRSSLAAGTLFALTSVLVLMIYGVLGSYLLGAGFAPPITNLPDAFYFTIVTMSTVGYGDILPKSGEARLFVISLIILGLTVFATALTAVIGPVLQSRINRTIGPRRRKMKRVNHFIISGNGVLARNTVRELRQRGEAVLVIVEDEDASFGDAETIVGDPTELDTLREAGGVHARAILALSDDDSENAFVILAVHEMGTDAKKVAAVSTRKNLERVRRVRPDMILAAPVFGSEVLAMALTEEKIDGDWLLSRFLDVRPASG